MSKAQLDELRNQEISGNKINNEHAVLNYIANNKHCTINDLIKNLSIQKVTIVARLSSLEEKGLIYKTGKVKENKRSYSTFIYEPNIEKQHYLTLKRKKFLKNKSIKSLLRFEDQLNITLVELLKSNYNGG